MMMHGHMRMYTCFAHVCTPTHVRMLYTCIHIYVYVYVYAHIHVYVKVHVHIYG